MRGTSFLFLALVVSLGIAQECDGEQCGLTEQTPLECEDQASTYFSETIVPGFHIVCLSTSDEKLTAKVWKDGMNNLITLTELHWDALKAVLEEKLDLNLLGAYPPAKLQWAFFTPTGTPIENQPSSMPALVFIFKGGRFIWPGVKIGHTQIINNVRDLGTVTITTISMQPLIFTTENFLSEEECAQIIDNANPGMKESPVSHHDGDVGKPAKEWRTSTQTWLVPSQHPFLRNIDNRVSDLTALPLENQEALQVLRYKLGQFYDAHHDFFNPALYQKDEGILKKTENGRVNRLVTVFFYLSNVKAGGETVFPRFGDYRGQVDFKSCERGLKIQPKRGKVAIFYSMLPDGQFDENSLHGACPVKDGLKWAANKWVWTGPQEQY